MKKTINGYLFNRIEKMGNEEYNHIGCEGEDDSFSNFLASFVPKIGARRKVKFTVETLDPTKPKANNGGELKAVETDIKNCRKCPEFNIKSPYISLAGQGNPDARLMFVAQSPCELCAVRQKVFYKGSGEIFDMCLREINEKRSSVFITNVCKCHTPNNRPNNKAEIDNCRHFLEKEIEIINPKIIIALGKQAKDWFGITDWNKFEDWQGRVVYALAHPAFIMRNPGMKGEYFKAWDALKKQ